MIFSEVLAKFRLGPDGGPPMRYFEDLKLGETLTIGGRVVEIAEAEDFAARYDPPLIPPAGRGYIHRGPEISPWQAAAISWKLLLDLAATASIEDASFRRPAEVAWGYMRVSVGDTLRIEVEIVELLPPSAREREHGRARVKVTLITNGPAGFGAWGDDDQELVDDIALTYSAILTARRRVETSIFHGIA